MRPRLLRKLGATALVVNTPGDLTALIQPNSEPLKMPSMTDADLDAEIRESIRQADAGEVMSVEECMRQVRADIRRMSDEDRAAIRK